jgi:NADPH:quinone reductase
MNAAWYEGKGPARQVLTVGQMADPNPLSGEVLVEIAASGVNPSDTKGRGGARGNTTMPFPRIIPHQDGAGTIVAVGDGVPAARIGERVWIYEAQLGRPFGTAAELATVAAENAVPLPTGTSFQEGACLGVPALTAHRCVLADGPVSGQVLLVTGGAGAVGFYAIQFAKNAGATVVTTVSSDAQADIARRAGADFVINRREQDVAAEAARLLGSGERCIDRVIEVAFGANLDTTLKVLKPRGIIATYASDAVPEPALPFWPLVTLDAIVRFILVYVMDKEAHRQGIEATLAGLREGWLKHNVAHQFPLAAIADAHELLESGHADGKIVVTVGR